MAFLKSTLTYSWPYKTGLKAAKCLDLDQGKNLNLKLNGVFADVKKDSLTVDFTSVTGNLYAFLATAHSDKVEPGTGEVISANLNAIDLTQILGWIISMLAIGLGSSFWYDTLRRLLEFISKVKA